MVLSVSKFELGSYVCAQLNHFFPDKHTVSEADIEKSLAITLQRIEYCFERVVHKRYVVEGVPFFDYLYADHYILFLWFLSNTLFKERGFNQISSKLYLLNKALHAFDCMYDTQLPDIFLIFHGGGTMLGKAHYGDYFVALHGCTIGSHNGKYPVMGKGVALTAHSSIIGDCQIGKGVTLSIQSTVFERNVEPDTVVFIDRESGKTLFKPSRNPYAQQFFSIRFERL